MSKCLNVRGCHTLNLNLNLNLNLLLTAYFLLLPKVGQTYAHHRL